jgi:hypothetical protein
MAKRTVHPDWYWKAAEAIDREARVCFDVAADCGQMFGNVKHMTWFHRAVAEELGLVQP